MLNLKRRINLIITGGVSCSILFSLLQLLPHSTTMGVPQAITRCFGTNGTPSHAPPSSENTRKDKSSYRHNLTVFPDPTLSFRGKRRSIPHGSLPTLITHLFSDNLWSDKKYITVCCFHWQRPLGKLLTRLR